MEELIPPAPSRRMSEAEYLRMEESAPTKHEYRNGEAIDMAGGTWAHAVIAANMISELKARLRGKPCQPLGSDLRVRIPGKGHYCYPDVTVVCGQPIFDPPDKTTTIINPQVVIEVTSPSSVKDDQIAKFDDYRRLESLMEYIIVSQEKADVKTFYRQTDGIWAFGPTFTQLDQSVSFRSLSVVIPLADIYANVTFPTEIDSKPV